MLFMGVDVGTQGVRTIAADEKGNIAAKKSVTFAKINEASEPGLYEQKAEIWWKAAVESISDTVDQLKKSGHRPEEIQAIAVDGTSGTILPIDRSGRPLSNALMYNDNRAAGYVDEIRKYAAQHEQKLGLRFNASFSLPRILWLKKERPALYESCWKIVHQTDYIVGMLCGEFGISDYSNSLKTGYDLIDEKWPSFFSDLDIEVSKLPEIIKPGGTIGKVSAAAAEKLGLSVSTLVVAGATDGYASALAAGACRVGDWASIIGTTLVLKGVSRDIVIDSAGAAYCHKLPTGAWLVGGASNVGGRCLNVRFSTERFLELNQTVDQLTPTGVLIYPLTAQGERYPFIDPNAREFILGDVSDERVLYTALMEGVGYAERLSYELLMKSGCEVGSEIYTTGGACKSEEWLRIRAGIMNRALKIPSTVDAAMGMVLIAATSYFGDLSLAAERMLTFAKIVEPEKDHVKRYDELYCAFEEECCHRFSIGR